MENEHDFSVIRFLRSQKNLTLKALAQKAGLTYSTVALIELNKSAPSFNTIKSLAYALQVPTSELITLAEKHLVQISQIEPVNISCTHTSPYPAKDVKLARFRNSKVFRLYGQTGQTGLAMDMHEDCYELIIVLSGAINIDIGNKPHVIAQDGVILYDGEVEHSLTFLEDSELIIIHIPKNLYSIKSLLKEYGDLIPADAMSCE